ncbi:hypothetical protein P7K49_012690 [Saguinus oedipus]|uniref:Uncharacterized protein n=1 Tax=Saguinus oedipus TaxID=9490 RepID=A0ABQ9VDS9_SAGOE|nr:hypothetical protein P7K49_012690 [Saguinus oedipus]
MQRDLAQNSLVRDGAARWGRGVRHYGHNLPLLKYRPGLTKPAVAKATCHNRERSTAERSLAAAGWTRASRAEPRQANKNVKTKILKQTKRTGATAFGILNGLCKFGAILGNTIFASFVGITKVVPILLAAASLVGGGLIALRLPETREQVLM